MPLTNIQPVLKVLFCLQNVNNASGNCIHDRSPQFYNLLKYYTEYTVSGCTLECETNATVDACGCRNYFFPGKFNP